MRALALLILFFATAAGATDLVFDLDWTLIYTTRESAVSADPSHTFTHGRLTYRFSDLAFDVLMELHRLPGVRISFFSGGGSERNEQVVRLLYQELNRRARIGESFAPHRIGSRDLLSAIGTSGRFAERFKKDLTRLIPDVKLDDALLIDDSGFAMPGQELNLVQLPRALDDIPVYSSAEWRSSSLREIPSDEHEWALERNKMAWVLGLIAQALESGDSRHKVVERVKLLQLEKDRVALTSEGLKRLGLPANPYRRWIGVCEGSLR